MKHMNITTTTTDLLTLNPAAKGHQLREQFSALTGFEWDSADRAHVAFNDRTALITFDAAGDLRITVPVDESFDPAAALEFNCQLPSNLRFALDQRRLQLVADMRSDDPPHLLDEIAAGAELALRCQAPEQETRDDDLDKHAVEELLHSLSQHDESLAELEQGWEYRPRVGGQSIAVKLNIQGQKLHCYRTVMQVAAESAMNRAAAVEALRFNAQIKHARLARTDSRLVAETSLHRCLLNKSALSVALRAIALAERRAHAALEILASDDRVSVQYSSLFDCCEPKLTST